MFCGGGKKRIQFSSQLGVVCSFQAGLVRAQQPLPSYLLCPSQVLADIQNAYFPSNAWNTMMCIAWQESSYNVNAEDNDSNGTTDYGLFQINRFVHHCCFFYSNKDRPVDTLFPVCD
jgi:hypothetical protein